MNMGETGYVMLRGGGNEMQRVLFLCFASLICLITAFIALEHHPLKIVVER